MKSKFGQSFVNALVSQSKLGKISNCLYRRNFRMKTDVNMKICVNTKLCARNKILASEVQNLIQQRLACRIFKSYILRKL